MRGPREMPRKRCGSQRCVGPEGHKPSQTPRREMRARVAHFLVLPPFHPKYILWFAKYYGLIPVVSRALHKAPLCTGWTGPARPIPCTKAARHAWPSKHPESSMIIDINPARFPFLGFISPFCSCRVVQSPQNSLSRPSSLLSPDSDATLAEWTVQTRQRNSRRSQLRNKQVRLAPLSSNVPSLRV